MEEVERATRALSLKAFRCPRGAPECGRRTNRCAAKLKGDELEWGHLRRRSAEARENICGLLHQDVGAFAAAETVSAQHDRV
jgi:hypothetical protein